MNFAIIAAVDRVRGIGKKGELSWYLKGDLKHFAEVTKTISKDGFQNAVIMGRKTWESLPEKFRPLPGRLNVVVSRDSGLRIQDSAVVVDSLDTGLLEVEKPEYKIERAFVIGGGQLYTAAIKHPSCERLYITEVAGEFGCDIFFPEITNYKLQITGEWHEENNIRYRFTEYGR